MDPVDGKPLLSDTDESTAYSYITKIAKITSNKKTETQQMGWDVAAHRVVPESEEGERKKY